MTGGNLASIQVAEQDYFAINPAPTSLQSHLTIAREFITRHAEGGRNVVLVTSGGTTVPLENQTVRYIDNFSAGTRGACSAEYFLEAGYAVIFLHRQFSLLPYSRHYSHNTRSFLDYMGEEDGKVVVEDEHQEDMLRVLRSYTAAKKKNQLLILSFVTITEYLWELREVAKLMRPLGPRAIFYLAAAVSDFFVPKDQMVEHKIQSSEAFSKRLDDPNAKAPAARTDGSKLVIDLEPVPKFLKQLVDGWAPDAMIVSFKLETDPKILINKARYSLEKYQHHLVIGNLLTTRKWEVVFVTAGGERWVRVPPRRRTKSVSGVASLIGKSEEKDGDSSTDDDQAVEEVMEGEPPVEIESLIIPAVAEIHKGLLANGK
ncbi:DFP-domain-containing protein [Eremomyces bilateralis CBS 781.70]|uniref:DFP-domain-containing protein n=1 Tax=Eremomyces bilateralis CBS 781.70 TaxID=1392243 RepID=A0A6G1FW06_9PEZI|nr:DFP-domain-containing protein [Eremomyces bilateralis CBS 781.70]KAF1809908.1 DFP-domain-containing protein [Eremomyces bilateralis CBS 781.70]